MQEVNSKSKGVKAKSKIRSSKYSENQGIINENSKEGTNLESPTYVGIK